MQHRRVPTSGPNHDLPTQVDEQGKEGQIQASAVEGVEHEIVERLDQLTGMVNLRRLMQHEAIDTVCEEGRGHAVTGNVADADDDMLLVLEVH